jgi:hypothetical protein
VKTLFGGDVDLEPLSRAGKYLFKRFGQVTPSSVDAAG